MIKFEGVTKTFKEGLTGRKVHALEDLHLEIFQGEVFGFLGPNGAGKSTTIKTLINLIRPDRGRVTVAGLDVGISRVRKEIGFLPENPYFYDYLSAEELLWFGGRASGIDTGTIRSRTDLLLEKVGLQDARKRPLRTYSKGMVQRAGLALSLIHDPQVVVLDEPMSGLDPLGRKMVVDLILELKGEGKTVFFSSHILSDIERLCDRIGIIAKGRLRLVQPLNNISATGETLEEVFMREVVGSTGGAS